VVGENIKGNLQLQRVMWALGIEPGEPAQQALVELQQVVEQQLLVNIMELILHGAIQCAFMSGVRGRCASARPRGHSERCRSVERTLDRSPGLPDAP
jgi:hypothetical protein